MQKYTLGTERLTLKIIAISDAEIISQRANNYDIYQTTLRIPFPCTLDSVVEWIKKTEHHNKHSDDDHIYTFSIYSKQINQPIGIIGLETKTLNNNAEVGYWLSQEFWNQGFMTEALKAVINFGFKTLNLNKIYAEHMLTNPASARVMKKAGMQYQARLVQEVKKEGDYLDVESYYILQQDYK